MQQQTTHSIIVSIITVIKAMYKNQAAEINNKLQNIDYINLDTLVNKVEKEIPIDNISDSQDKIVEIIESIIQD
jgi:hypothetical protein